MNSISGTFQDGHIIFDSQVDWPDGTRVKLYAVPPTTGDQPSGKELDRLLNELADLGEATIDPKTPPLSDYAMSRAGIYGEHP